MEVSEAVDLEDLGDVDNSIQLLKRKIE